MVIYWFIEHFGKVYYLHLEMLVLELIEMVVISIKEVN